MRNQPLVTIKNLSYQINNHPILQDISLTLEEGKCLALVGESGSGKSSLALALLGLITPSSGSISFSFPKDLPKAEAVQIIFQDIHSSVNPLMTVKQIICEPLTILKKHSRKEQAFLLEEVLDVLNISKELLFTSPQKLSGGQKQRIAIARAIITKPRLLICDEPLTSLDAPNQALALNLFRKIKEQYRNTMIFITHDMPAAYNIADDIAVMYKGSLVENSPKEQLFLCPAHFHTKELLAAIPKLYTHNS